MKPRDSNLLDYLKSSAVPNNTDDTIILYIHTIIGILFLYILIVNNCYYKIYCYRHRIRYRRHFAPIASAPTNAARQYGTLDVGRQPSLRLCRRVHRQHQR